jgi:uncharacterized repeat protein (TIGR02543 family)
LRKTENTGVIVDCLYDSGRDTPFGWRKDRPGGGSKPECRTGWIDIKKRRLNEVKKKAVSFLMAVCLVISAGVPYAGSVVSEAAANLEEGLVGHWDFEDGELTNKVSGSGYTAEKIGNGVTLKSDGGVSGGSAYFSKEADSCIKLSQILNAAEDDFTIAAWVKYDSDAFDGTNDNMNLFQQSGDGKTILFLRKSDTKYGTFLTGSNSLCDNSTELGTWNHVAVTSNHSTKQVQFYQNGSLVNTNTLSGDFVNAVTDVLIGNHKSLTASTAIKGSVDELRYYNTVVSADTVKAMYDEFAPAIQLETLKSELEALITEAGTLSGGTEAAAAGVLQAAMEAQEYLAGDDLTAERLADLKAQLETAMEKYSQDVLIEIAVDTTSKLRDIPSAMFGINHRYHKDGYGSWDMTTNAVAEEFNEYAKDAGFGSVRYPGGTVSNLFTWKDTIGPLEERTTTIGGNNFYSSAGETPVTPVFGVDEAMKWIYDDLNSEAIFVYGLGRGNPADAADLVEYLNAPNDGSNPNGGTDWAQVRAENGHEEPYGVKCFEIGNEFSDTGQNYWMSGISQNNKGTVDLYIEGDTMTISGQQSYYQINNYVSKKGDWRAAASLSDGNPGEERYVYYLPVVEGSATVYVAGTQWSIVDSLEGQGAANVCTFDYATGKITFGDGINGNIPAAGARITCNYQTNQAGFVDYYDAMKEVAEQIGMDIEIYSGIVDRLQKDFITKMKEKGYNDKYDGVIIHPYSSGYGSADSYEASLTKEKAQVAYVASHKTAMEEATGDNSKEVAVSEFGILGPASDYQTSLGHAIYIANHMIDCVNAGAAYQNKHCLVDFTVGDNLGAWQQCVIQCHNLSDGTYRYVSTPSARLFSIFNNMTGNTEVAQTITGNGDYYTDGNGTVQNINVYSTKDDEGNTYVLIVNNKKTESSSVAITVDDRDLTDEDIAVWYLTSENVDDMNTLDEPDKVAVEKINVTANGSELTYTLAPHSVTSFKIPAEKINITPSVSGEGGSVIGAENAAVGSEATVTAVPADGYEFDGWYVGEEKVSDQLEYTFTVAEDVKLTAKFKKKQEADELKPDEPKPPVQGSSVQNPENGQNVTKVTAPAAPKKLKAKKTKKGIRLTWKKVSGADGYIVYRSYKKNGKYKKIATIKKGSRTTYLYKKAKKGKIAYYKVKAYRKNGSKKLLSVYSKTVRKKK